MDSNKRLRRTEAAIYLHDNHGIRRTASTLAKLAVVGGGPRFQVAGRTPLYSPDELDLWAESILSPTVGSTTELREYRAQNITDGPSASTNPSRRSQINKKRNKGQLGGIAKESYDRVFAEEPATS